jgi:hypothetical protein
MGSIPVRRTINNLMKKEVSIEWLATGIFLISVLLTSFNVYPLNVFVALAANILWLWLGFIWKKWSLIIVEAVVVIIYLIGTIKVIAV